MWVSSWSEFLKWWILLLLGFPLPSFYCQICIELFSGCLDLEVREPNGSQKLIFSGISQNWIDMKRHSFDC